MIKSTRLTPLGIERKKAKTIDSWQSDDEGTRGGGRLVIRISTSGSKLFYFRYSINGVRKQIPIGPFAADPVEGKYTLDQARQVARSYSAMHRDPKTRDVAAHLQELQDARVAERLKAEESAKLESHNATLASKHSLRALCERYIKHLEDGKKQSAASVRNRLTLHVYSTEWADLPAKNFTAKQATTLLRNIVDFATGHTAKQVRSFLHAAYGLAIRSELDATIASELIGFDIEVNPIASTSALSQFNKTRDRVLSATEMGEIWKRIGKASQDDALVVRALRLTILLGGQRGLQLLRVKRVEDVDLESGIITIYDPKGRRLVPRAHALPLVGKAVEEVESLIKRSEALESEWLFHGTKKHLGADAISDLVHGLSIALNEEGISKQQFQFSDFRRTAETMMASIGIHKDIRAQLQSHGLGGVQSRHYDRHEYMDEKRAAITSWQGHLDFLATGKPMESNVREIKRA